MFRLLFWRKAKVYKDGIFITPQQRVQLIFLIDSWLHKVGDLDSPDYVKSVRELRKVIDNAK